MIAFFSAGFGDCAVVVLDSGTFGVGGVPVASADRSYFGARTFPALVLRDSLIIRILIILISVVPLKSKNPRIEKRRF